MQTYLHTNLETLANKFLEDVLSKSNFGASNTKGGFLTGGSLIVCESKGLQEYLRKTCADKYGIWTALPFKPLAGLLMQCAYNLSKSKKDEKENIYNQHNLVWAIYALLEGEKKTFSFANEVTSLFFAYQIYRPELIEKWENNKLDKSITKNEEWQKKLWLELKEKYEDEQNIYELYKSIESELKNEKKILPKQIFIFAPLSIAPIHLSTLTHLSQAGSKVNLYLLQVSEEYIGTSVSDKQIARIRKEAWANNKIANENELYWDLGNRLIANLGRNAQVIYEQISEYEEQGKVFCEFLNSENNNSSETLLSKIQNDIIQDNNEPYPLSHIPYPLNTGLTFNNCFSPLREIEVLCDYLLDLFAEKKILPNEIAVVSPNIENYASSIESVFGRYNIPFQIADRDVKKYDKTTQLLNLLFAQIGGRYEAPDILALFEYSRFVQGKELDSNDRERLEKWVKENAIRHNLNSPTPAPNYSFAGGFEQLKAGFFMISEDGFSELGDYCYPDIEGNAAHIFGEFAYFVKTLEKFDTESKKEKLIEEWNVFLKENLQVFFGEDATDFNEDQDDPYQKVIEVWNSLKEEMYIGFGNKQKMQISFSTLKNALLRKMESSAKSSYSMTGKISFSNFETIRAVPHKVICCIGMNSKEFPRQVQSKEISLMTEYKQGDRDIANEERLMFLEIICNAREKLYISWIGQNEKTAEDLEPSSVVIVFLKNLEEQYKIKPEDLIVKHPLQPFSKKYFNGTLSTYDNRWLKPENSDSSNIWEWRIQVKETEEKRDIDALFKILSDTPKYFLKTICNIELPETIELLENTEPFIVERGLDKWKLSDLILKNENRDKYMEEIKISKLRGSLPSGKFASKIIENAAIEMEELKEKAKNEKEGTYWIYPSNDKGRYRLKHWLYHLNLNAEKENQNTKIFLKDAVIELRGMPKKEANEILNKLWELKQELEKRMLPIFPDAAWEYLKSNKSEAEKIKVAEEKIFGDGFNKGLVEYSGYAKKILGEAKSFKDLGVEKEFVDCSERLFGGYKNAAS
ncbi:MAG: exodeoxyribonuclease V subunit gamma [Fibromonadaceae bacterium]|jgi:exodeoxyribonuclease V gamma subunit|nr:exodeoxyribonuclease V subunit gamma [Fibromonadaceae bacterium]